jgi:hypothetical protein
MVDVQTIGVLVTAASVCIATGYYIFNVREVTKNRRTTFTINLLNTIETKEAVRDYYELMSMKWTDFNDFLGKYDSRVNPENWIKRDYYWNLCDKIGWQLRVGLVDWKTVLKNGRYLNYMWRKFKPIIEEYRKREIGHEALVDWEYLADRVEEVTSLEDKRLTQYMVDDASDLRIHVLLDAHA